MRDVTEPPPRPAPVHGCLELPWPGRLFHGRLYDTQQEVDATFDYLAQHGVTTVWNLLEMEAAAALERRRFAVVHSPIDDFDVPADRASFLRDARQVLSILERGEGVFVHCFAGRGRTGTAVLVLKVLCGADPAAALAEVRAAIGGPECQGQVEFALSFAP